MTKHSTIQDYLFYRLEKGRISVNHEGCLECGSCRIACPQFNIEWRFPTGGFGIRHKFG